MTLGAILPLTGSAALYGENARKGVELAVAQQAGDSLKYRFRLVVEDDRTLPQDAVTAFHKLVGQDRVSAIIGPLPSSNAMAVAPLANEAQIPILSPGASTPRLTGAGPYVFRNWQSDAVEAGVMSGYLIAHKITRVGVLAVNNDFGLALSQFFDSTFTRKGGSVTGVETFDQGAVDFRAQLLKLRQGSPGALYLLSYPNETAHAVNQARDLGLRVPIFGVAAMEDPTLLTVARANAEGITYTKAVGADTTDAAFKGFTQAFKARYGEDPGLIGDTGYDATRMLMLAISQASSLSGADIRAALSALKPFHGASGLQSFDSNGDIVKNVGIKTIRNGAFEWLQR